MTAEEAIRSICAKLGWQVNVDRHRTESDGEFKNASVSVFLRIKPEETVDADGSRMMAPACNAYAMIRVPDTCPPLGIEPEWHWIRGRQLKAGSKTDSEDKPVNEAFLYENLLDGMVGRAVGSESRGVWRIPDATSPEELMLKLEAMDFGKDSKED